MPFNPNMRNASMPTVKNTAKKKTPTAQPKPRPVGNQQFTAPDEAQSEQMNAADPAERYKQVLQMMGHQLGNRQGNTGLHFNQGQQDWLQSLSLSDMLKELSGAFNRQRPHFGNPVQHGGVPSPVGPQIANEVPQPMPGGGGMTNTAMASGQPDLMSAISQLRDAYGAGPMVHPVQSTPGYWTPERIAATQPMPMPTVDMGMGGRYGGGVPSPINGGGFLGGGNPLLGGGMQNMNGGGYQASGQNPNMVALINALTRRGGRPNY